MNWKGQYFILKKVGLLANTESGKAFEYACLLAIYDFYKEKEVPVEIIESPQLETAKSYFDALSDHGKNDLLAGEAAIKLINLLEPKLDHYADNSVLKLTLQTDSNGQKGDVRDILCIRNDSKRKSWELGISCKHNHFALKHSRISPTIDFGKEWLGKQCSSEYMEKVGKIFAHLKPYVKEKWDKVSDKVDKVDDVYKPLLKAFMDELTRLDEEYPGEIAPALVNYLIGEKDFYKVISVEKKHITLITPVNLHDSLNERYKDHRSMFSIEKPKLPSVIYHIGFKKVLDKKTNAINQSDNTIIVTCDEGWSFSLRIHNASSKVENSMKFDIESVSTPESIRSFIAPWNV